MKVYLAHPISTKGEFNDSKRVANEIRSLGFEVYAAAENAGINDKTNDPTPVNIYEADIPEVLSSDIVVVNITGGDQDGTLSEVGATAGWNEAYQSDGAVLPILGYTSSPRLQHPQLYKGIPSAKGNHLVLGMIEKWGEFVGGEEDMLANLKEELSK